jgi:thermostable 8-oxoguanine DNA glycosylase
MEYDEALKHIDSVQAQEVERYTRYLENIRPKTHEERFKRWLFAYASVHTGWKMNCKLYYSLRDMAWLGDKEALRKCIVDCRAGFHNKRVEYIHGFSEFYWKHPDWFNKSSHETWVAYRDRIEGAALGIGHAKGAFMVELMYPLEAQVVCVDTHILQLYGFTPQQINERGIRRRDMYTIEKHWIDCCGLVDIPPVIARWVYWDRKQGHADSRYWSHVFEEENYHVRLAKLASTTE